MARLKHIAIRTPDVTGTAAFYKEAFDLREVGKGRSGVYLSDGHINIAILNLKTPVSPAGVDHFGFQVDDLEKTVERVVRLDGEQLTDLARATPADPSHPQSYFEVKLAGPDRQEIDVSDTGWAGAPCHDVDGYQSGARPEKGNEAQQAEGTENAGSAGQAEARGTTPH